MKINAKQLLLLLLVKLVDSVYFTNNCPQSYTCDITTGILTLRCSQSCSLTPLSIPAASANSGLASLLSIIAKNNALRNMPANICQYGSSLRILDLSSNAITDTLTASYLSCLVQIETLYLSKNMISTIDENAFDTHTNLKTLDLSSNKLVFLPAKLFVLKTPALQTLKLQNNLLTEIDVWFFYLQSINFIDLSNNQISKFSNKIGWSPRNTSTLTHLLNSRSSIDMSSNKFTRLDDDLLLEYKLCSSSDLSYFLKLIYTVMLSNNNFICSCDSYNLLMLYKTLISENAITPSENLFKTYCASPANYQSMSVFSFEDPNNCVGISKYSPIVLDECLRSDVTSLTNALLQNPSALQTSLDNQPVQSSLTPAQIAGIVIGFLGVFFLILVLLYCLCPIEILACIFDCCPRLYTICPCKSGVFTNKYYDVFVSYNKSSDKWIKNQLLPFFQEERPYDRYYLQHDSGNPDKHGQFGSFTKEKMNNSATILLVLSDSYLIKEWSNTAFRDHLRLLLTKPHKDSKDMTRLLCIQLHDVSDEEVDDHIRSKLQLPRFISLETDEFLFWKKLEYFLYMNKDTDQIVTPVNMPISESSAEDSITIEEKGVDNEQFLLDEYSTSLEQIICEKQPKPYENEAIQDIKYDHLNKKFTIKIGGQDVYDHNSSFQEVEESNERRKHKKRGKHTNHTTHYEETEEQYDQKILNESVKNQGHQYYRSINRTPRRKTESTERSTNESRSSSQKNSILKCSDPNNMVFY